MADTPRTWGALVALLGAEDARVFHVKYGQNLFPSADINNPVSPYNLFQTDMSDAAKRFLTERGIEFDTTIGDPPAAYTAQADLPVQSGNLTRQNVTDLKAAPAGAVSWENDGRVPPLTDADLAPGEEEPENPEEPEDPEPEPEPEPEDTTPPEAPALGEPEGGDDNIITLTGVAEEGATVTVTWPDATTSVVTADAETGSWSATSAVAQPDGTISVIARDAAGNESEPATTTWVHVEPT